MPRRRSNNPAGRPSKGLTEARLELRMPRELLGAARTLALADGVSVNEWWRRAGRAAIDAAIAGPVDTRVPAEEWG